MKEESLNAIHSTIDEWTSQNKYSFQKKNFLVEKNSTNIGEYRMKFTNEIHGFFCNDKEIPIFLVSQELLTNTLSSSPLSENANADNFRLKKLLKEFDEQFDEYVKSKWNECEGSIFTSDPLFF